MTLDWLRQALGLPRPMFGVINDTASSGSLYALAAAREALTDLHIRQQGMSGRPEVPRLRYYASQEAHSSVEKAGIVLGVGQSGLRKIGVDSEFRMDVSELERAIREDIAAGCRPFAVVATIGTTATTSIDPVPQIADICERYGLWLHVDAAWGGAAALLPDPDPAFRGLARADSLTFDPHKWMSVPLGLGLLLTRHRGLLERTFAVGSTFVDAHDEEPESFARSLRWSRCASRE